MRCPVLWSHLCAVIKNRAHDNSHNLVHVHLSKSVVLLFTLRSANETRHEIALTEVEFFLLNSVKTDGTVKIENVAL